MQLATDGQFENTTAQAAILSANISSDSETVEKFCVNLPVFDGHFDALLLMIEKQDVDICDVSLSDVTRQYLEYYSAAASMNLTVASEFLAVAAYLVELKSKAVLPVEKEEEAIEEIKSSLIDHVMQYRIFKQVASVLKERKELFSKIFHRAKMDPGVAGNKQYFLRDVSVSDLVDAFRKVWVDSKDKTENNEIVDEIVTVEEKISQIEKRIIGKKDGLKFEGLFMTRSRIEIIVTFLAVLEMIRLRQLVIKQDETFGQIMLFSKADYEEIVSNG